MGHGWESSDKDPLPGAAIGKAGLACQQTPGSLYVLLWPELISANAKSMLSLFVQNFLEAETEQAWVAWVFLKKDKIFSLSGSQTFLLL